MKKIFAVSLIAMTAVTAANADIASKAYVDPAANGTYILKTKTTGQNLTALDTAVKANADKLPSGETTVADAIATALQNAKVASAIQGVQKNGTALTPDANGVVNVTVPTGALAALDAVAEANLTSELATKINGKANAATTLAGYGITDGVQKNDAITGATKTKITYDSKGLVTAGADLAESDIPALSISKTTGLQSALDAKEVSTNKVTSMSAQSTDTQYPSAKAVYDADKAITDSIGTVPANSTVMAEIAAAQTASVANLDLAEVGGDGNVILTVSQSNGQVAATAGKIGNANIASDAAIEKSKLASGVQTSLTAADNALPAATYTSEVGTVSAANMGTTAGTVVGAISETHGLAAGAIPKPSGNCTDCVLHYNGSVFTWEDIARPAGS